MTSITNCLHKLSRRFGTMPAVSAVLRPRLNSIPVRSKIRVLANLFETRVLKTRDSNQLPQVVRMAGFYLPPIREFVPPGYLCDACLERALHRIASQVIRAFASSHLYQCRPFL